MVNQHAIERARERYGLIIDRNDLRDIVLQIINHVAGQHSSCLLLSLRDGCESWMLVWCGHLLRVVYNPARAHIVTFLPLFCSNNAEPIAARPKKWREVEVDETAMFDVPDDLENDWQRYCDPRPPTSLAAAFLRLND